MSDIVSVIIPVYNSSKTIIACLNSLINQEYSFLEIIIVNDGSTDNTLLIIEEFIQNDSKFKLITTENKGQGHARNIGLKNASGGFIVFLDADDELEANTISENIHYFRDSSIEFIQFPIVYDVNTDKPKLFIPPKKVLTNSDEILSSFFIQKFLTWLVCGKIFRRAFLKDEFFLESIFYEDNEMILRLYAKAHKVLISESGLYKYFYYPSSTSNSSVSFFKKNIDTLFVVDSTIAFIEKHYPSKNILIDYIARSNNIRKSILRIEPNYNFPISLDLKDISNIDILFARISIKEKMKLFLLLFNK
jgi:glycosyltransferase involved in cell wall biosynthesis